MEPDSSSVLALIKTLISLPHPQVLLRFVRNENKERSAWWEEAKRKASVPQLHAHCAWQSDKGTTTEDDDDDISHNHASHMTFPYMYMYHKTNKKKQRILKKANKIRAPNL